MSARVRIYETVAAFPGNNRQTSRSIALTARALYHKQPFATILDPRAGSGWIVQDIGFTGVSKNIVFTLRFTKCTLSVRGTLKGGALLCAEFDPSWKQGLAQARLLLLCPAPSLTAPHKNPVGWAGFLCPRGIYANRVGTKNVPTLHTVSDAAMTAPIKAVPSPASTYFMACRQPLWHPH